MPEGFHIRIKYDGGEDDWIVNFLTKNSTSRAFHAIQRAMEAHLDWCKVNGENGPKLIKLIGAREVSQHNKESINHEDGPPV